MFKNYLKITWKVLMRKKLYTFSSFLGICLTLTVIIVASSFYDLLLKPNYPFYRQKNTLLINRVELWGKDQHHDYSSWSAGYKFLVNYVKGISAANMITIFSENTTDIPFYQNDKKIKLSIKYTDADFWKILDFDFLDGRPYHYNEVLNSDNLIVINESLSKNIFGSTNNVVGKYLDVDKKNYKIAGIVRDVSPVRFNIYGNVWAPVTTSKMDLKSEKLTGPFSALVYSDNRKKFKSILDEYNKNLKNIRFPKPEYQWNINAQMIPFKNAVVNNYFFNNELNWFRFQIIIITVLCLFGLLPLLNILNINSNRLFERHSEIGLRKSFGASKKSITIQFLFENLIITIISGLFAYILALIILKIIQYGNIIQDGTLNINFRTFMISFSIIILFGILTGVLPAVKISQQQIVNALNNK